MVGFGILFIIRLIGGYYQLESGLMFLFSLIAFLLMRSSMWMKKKDTMKNRRMMKYGIGCLMAANFVLGFNDSAERLYFNLPGVIMTVIV